MSSTNRGAERAPNDGYQTPPWSIEAILRRVQVGGSVLEPCSGSGNIVRALREIPAVHTVAEYEIERGMDFLTARVPFYDWVVTNPPYSLAKEFIDKSRFLAPNVLMLLRINFLGSQERRAWWENNLPSALFVLSKRPRFLDWDGKPVIGKNGKPGTDSCEYAWFYWGSEHRGIYVL